MPLVRQLTALNGEIAVRKRELEKDVRDGRMRQSEAEYVIASLEAIGGTLNWLLSIEPVLKQRLFNGDVAPAGGCW